MNGDGNFKMFEYQRDWDHSRIRDVENLKQEVASLNQRKQPQAATQQELQEVRSDHVSVLPLSGFNNNDNNNNNYIYKAH